MGKHILVIDQSPTIQGLLKTFLQMERHTVISCGTGREALAVLAGLELVPDVIIVAFDYQKEVYCLFEQTQGLERYRQIHLIALVLPVEQAEIQRALCGRTVSYLHKPFHIQEVLALVNASAPTGAAFSGTPFSQKKGDV